jgi:hypothetical protein
MSRIPQSEAQSSPTPLVKSPVEPSQDNKVTDALKSATGGDSKPEVVQQKTDKTKLPLNLAFSAGLSTFAPGPDYRTYLKHSDIVIASAAYTQFLSPHWGLSLEVNRDDLLQNRLFAMALYKQAAQGRVPSLRFEAGPFVSFLNSSQVLINGGLRLGAQAGFLNDRLTAALRFDFSFQTRLETPGDYTLGLLAARVSWRFPVGTLGVSASVRQMRKIDDSYLFVSQRWARIVLSFDEIRFSLMDLGVSLGGNFIDWKTSLASLSYKNMFLGLNVGVWFRPNMEIYAGAELPLYPFPYPYTSNFQNPQATLLFSVFLGFKWKVR